MRVSSSAFGLGLLLVLSSASSPLWAQKIIHIEGAAPGKTVKIVKSVRVHKFSRVHLRRFRHKRRFAKGRLPRLHLSTFSFPDQTYFPPYYSWPQPYAKGPDMTGRIEGGRTVEQGSAWGSHIDGGKTAEQGAATRGHIVAGRTVEGGSRWASRITAGRTAEQGSRWRSTMPNWRFSGYAAPMRPKGISYYRTKRRARSPWASRIR